MLKEFNNKYKETAIGLIPNDWKVERFDSVFELFSTNSFSRDNLTYDVTLNEIQNIHYGDIHSKFKSEILDCEIEKLPYIKDELILNQKFNYLKDGDLIITDASEDYAGVGECIEVKNIKSKKIVSGLHTFLARDISNKTVQGFRTYIFNNPKVGVELKKIATGTSVYSISKSELQKLKIPIPPVEEQQKIATILSTWDKAIDNCKSIIDNLKHRNNGLTQKLLSGKMRVKGFNEKWKVRIMSECLNFTPRPILKPVENYLALGLRSHGKGIFHKTDFDPASIAMETMYEVKENDLIINITFAWEHAVAIVSKKDESGLVSHRFPTYTFNSQNSIPEYFRHFILQKRFKFLLELISPGGAGRNRVMSKTDFLKLEIKLPDVEEQKAIATILDKASEELNQYQQKLETLQLEKKGIMQQLLTGKVRTI
ncbi:type I restriction enzyme S subunit [Mariniflexile fucanivorans]|uniref:Type I restriction enzyme S subunit n=1 Tax=Mariniflexile fucanivorans TaxID=264023 RepID=A0A4R1RDV3_9FLAO|nr:restriction endonuclease subunit S [Mariniflexile fucanivorans]TCL64055.1 type I restriction enzyme S subunit [Mariniflexile fucanivorans]